MDRILRSNKLERKRFTRYITSRVMHPFRGEAVRSQSFDLYSKKT